MKKLWISVVRTKKLTKNINILDCERYKKIQFENIEKEMKILDHKTNIEKDSMLERFDYGYFYFADKDELPLILFSLQTVKSYGTVKKGIYRISDKLKGDKRVKRYNTDLSGDNIVICSSRHYKNFDKTKFGWIFIYTMPEPHIIICQ